jgi:2-polyprenyl-3-methyl-5-hydroxy-6-metoxy-1,4-benzoquinol methylase
MKLETEADSFEWLWAAKALAVVSAWNSLGLFDKLRAGPAFRRDLPGDPRALAITIPILAHVGLLATDGERIALTAAAERLVDQHAMPTDRNLVMLRDLGRFAELLRDGGPAKDDEGRSKATRGGTVDDVQATERFLDMLYRLSEPAAKATFTWLGRELVPGGAVLDLGGGHGRFARTFADAGHTVTLFDQPHVVALAKKRHGDALRYLEGDFHEVSSFGGPYDLVLMCNIVHGESPSANASIVSRAAAGLRSGGRLAIEDMFIDEHEQNPPSAVFFGLTMLLYTEKGESPTVRRAKEWLSSTGLVDVRMTALDSHQIISARKP